MAWVAPTRLDIVIVPTRHPPAIQEQELVISYEKIDKRAPIALSARRGYGQIFVLFWPMSLQGAEYFTKALRSCLRRRVEVQSGVDSIPFAQHVVLF